MARLLYRDVRASLLALVIVFGLSDAKSIVLFNRNVSDVFDFYPTSGDVESGEAVTLLCNGTGGANSRTVWLRRSLKGRGKEMDLRRSDLSYYVGANSLRIPAFGSAYAAQYACRRGKSTGDWITLNLAKTRNRACPYIDPPYDVSKTNESIDLALAVDCRASFRLFWMELRLYGRNTWKPLPQLSQTRYRIVGLRPTDMFEFRTRAYTTDGRTMASNARVIETYPNAPRRGPTYLRASNAEWNVSLPASVNLTWNSGRDGNGGGVVGYEIDFNVTHPGTSALQRDILVPRSHKSILVVVPEKGIRHDFVVYARNWGPYRSPPSPVASIIPATGPSPPQDVFVKSSCLSFLALVSWRPSRDTGGQPIIFYEVTISTSQPPKTAVRYKTTKTQLTFRPNSRNHIIQITAINPVAKSRPVSVHLDTYTHCILSDPLSVATNRPDSQIETALSNTRTETPSKTINILESEAKAWIRIGISAGGAIVAFAILGSILYYIKKSVFKKDCRIADAQTTLGLRYSRRRTPEVEGNDADAEAERVEVVCVRKTPGQLARVVSYTGKLPFDAPPPYATVIAAEEMAAAVENSARVESSIV